jgi:hypothetical protein
MFTECLADVLFTRSNYLDGLALFARPRIYIKIHVGKSVPENEPDMSLNRNSKTWIRLKQSILHAEKAIEIEVDLDVLLAKFNRAEDASSEVEILLNWLDLMSAHYGLPIPISVMEAIAQTKSKPPRFYVEIQENEIAFPDFVRSFLPQHRDYKVARKFLAIHFKKRGVKPGRYELKEAKKIINDVRLSYLEELEQKIDSLDRNSFLELLLHHYEAFLHDKRIRQKRIELSQNHEVEYDREESLSESRQSLMRDGGNFRYLIEKILSRKSAGGEPPDLDTMRHLLAYVDWLITLSYASDTLHYGIDVGGIDINDDYTPEVFYSKIAEEKEKSFIYETTQLKLGNNSVADDLNASRKGEITYIDTINEAMLLDAGFSFTELLAGLKILSGWPYYTKDTSVAAFYRATAEKIADVFSTKIIDFSKIKAMHLVEFLTLRKDLVLRLTGKDLVERDVPIWEHNKRENRMTIRPLLECSHGLLWGANSAERAMSIWKGVLIDGYLPAEMPWPHVDTELEKRHAELDLLLETIAHSIISRFAPYFDRSIDLFRRFQPKKFPDIEKFPDVGDYDVLSYWPQTNTWLVVECKNNKPPFCLKDSKRLCDTIFGDSEQDRGHIEKIERRHALLINRHTDVCRLLGWPESEESPRIVSVYVSKELHWWMRNSPYETEAVFLRIDMLDPWIRSNIMEVNPQSN